MPSTDIIRIANISESSDQASCWIRDRISQGIRVAGRCLEWHNFSAAPEIAYARHATIELARKARSLSRAKAAFELRAAAKLKPFDVVVSHGPIVSAWTEAFLPKSGGAPKHIAFAFNFTDLPIGLRKAFMIKAFRSVDEFAVFTKAERSLYSRYFNLDREKFVDAPWGVAPPLSAPSEKSSHAGYFAAIGGEARDYETLCAAARVLPDTHFIVVARPHNFDGLQPPKNIDVRFNLTHEETWQIVIKSFALIVPLRARDTPCGIVTIVGGMHVGKPQIVTETIGSVDYIENGKTGILVPPKDFLALANAVKTLHDNPILAAAIGAAASAYASENCSETATVRFFIERLETWFSRDRL